MHAQPTAGYGGYQGADFAVGHEGDGAEPNLAVRQHHVAGESDGEARSVLGEKRLHAKDGEAAAEPLAKRQQSSKAGSPVRCDSFVIVRLTLLNARSHCCATLDLML